MPSACIRSGLLRTCGEAAKQQPHHPVTLMKSRRLITAPEAEDEPS